jgi:hypothetical protein
MTTNQKIDKAYRLARRVYNCEHFGIHGYVAAQASYFKHGVFGYWRNTETDDVTLSERKAEQWAKRGDYVKFHEINGRG